MLEPKEAKVAVSQDGAIALQPGQQREMDGQTDGWTDRGREEERKRKRKKPRRVSKKPQECSQVGLA